MLRRLIFILSPHKRKLQSTTTASYFSFHLMVIVCVMANLLLKLTENFEFCTTSPYLTVILPNLAGGWSHYSLLSVPSFNPDENNYPLIWQPRYSEDSLWTLSWNITFAICYILAIFNTDFKWYYTVLQIFVKIGGPKWHMEQKIVGHFLKWWAQAYQTNHSWHWVVVYFTYTLTQTLVCIYVYSLLIIQ